MLNLCKMITIASLLLIACTGPTNDTTSNRVDDPCIEDNAVHAECQSTYGYLYFCGSSGESIPASGCEAEDCFVHGEGGDNCCQSTFGTCSECVPLEEDGMYSPTQCTE